jgi:hypothetical protein
MSKKIILHIGAGKTGTSAIQTGLARHRDFLLEQYGIFYPDDPSLDKAARGEISSGNGSYIGRFLNPNNRPANFSEDSFFLDLRKKINQTNAHTIIFSNEQIHIGKKEQLLTIANLFCDYFSEVQIIYYVRHVADSIMSSYIQRIKRHSYSGNFSDFLQRNKHISYKKI